MNKLTTENEEPRMLRVFAAEREAESLHQSGDHDGAVAEIQELLNTHIGQDRSDRGWYLQEMARYTYLQSKSKSNELQVNAHKLNRYLLRPKHGMQIQRLELLAQKRLENIIAWSWHVHLDFRGKDRIRSGRRGPTICGVLGQASAFCSNARARWISEDRR